VQEVAEWELSAVEEASCVVAVAVAVMCLDVVPKYAHLGEDHHEEGGEEVVVVVVVDDVVDDVVVDVVVVVVVVVADEVGEDGAAEVEAADWRIPMVALQQTCSFVFAFAERNVPDSCLPSSNNHYPPFAAIEPSCFE
jgi:hypothetical protein